ncbi:MAG TPA: hypothetical protein VFT29_12050, partial [Gemmatimonadaceae bacterium]|nr:hypothetical protein [Gemmatimonadaceae bacterium]
KELLDIIYCSLNKDPTDRFGTTRDMAIALENVPQSETDREEAEELLRELSAGRAITKVRTGTLPPLSITISGPGPRVQPRPVTSPRIRQPTAATLTPIRGRRKRKNKMMLPAMGLIFAGLGSGVFLQYQNIKEQEAKARADSQHVADSLEAEAKASRGTRVIVGLPDGVRVLINNQLYGNGERLEAPKGAYTASATASGFEPLITQVEVLAGENDTLTLVMKPLVAAAPPPAQVQQPRQAVVRAPVDSGEIRLSVMPTHAEISVDGNRIGSGRARARLPVGQHLIRYSAPNCDPEDRTLTVLKGEPQLVSLITLQCH